MPLPLSFIKAGSRAVLTGVSLALPGIDSLASSSTGACCTPAASLARRRGSSGARGPVSLGKAGLPTTVLPPGAAPARAVSS